MSIPLYVFDMDETLVNGDCAMIWNEFLVEKGIATQPNFLEQDQQLMALYAKGEMDMQDYLAFSIAPLAALPTSDVAILVEECVEQYILPKVFVQAASLIGQLKRNNVEMVVVSASVTFIVEAVAKKLGISHAIGIDLAEYQGCYSSKMIGTPSYREGKVTRLEQWLATQDQSFTEVHFYTDSINDLPLCNYADHTYLVNPCKQLSQYDHQDQWQILSWGIEK